VRVDEYGTMQQILQKIFFAILILIILVPSLYYISSLKKTNDRADENDRRQDLKVQRQSEEAQRERLKLYNQLIEFGICDRIPYSENPENYFDTIRLNILNRSSVLYRFSSEEVKELKQIMETKEVFDDQELIIFRSKDFIIFYYRHYDPENPFYSSKPDITQTLHRMFIEERVNEDTLGVFVQDGIIEFYVNCDSVDIHL